MYFRKTKEPSLLFCFLLLVSGCTSVHPSTGFIEDYSGLAKGKHFIRERVQSGGDLTHYQKVRVEPVTLKFFSSPYENYSQAELDKLASDMKASLESQLSKKFVVLKGSQAVDDQTLVVEPALVFVTSPERVVNLLTFWLIGFQFSKGAAAFEAKLLDGASNKVVAEVAEQRKGGGGITDIPSILIGGLFRFIHAEGAFKRWGKEILKMTEPPKS